MYYLVGLYGMHIFDANVFNGMQGKVLSCVCMQCDTMPGNAQNVTNVTCGSQTWQWKIHMNGFLQENHLSMVHFPLPSLTSGGYTCMFKADFSSWCYFCSTPDMGWQMMISIQDQQFYSGYCGASRYSRWTPLGDLGDPETSKWEGLSNEKRELDQLNMVKAGI